VRNKQVNVAKCQPGLDNGLGRRLTATEAAHFGFINQVVPHGTQLEVALEKAAQLRAMPPLAVRAIKELSVRAQYMPLQDGLRMEEAMQARLKFTDDAQEGPRAFAEKRQPDFHGR